jgi:hypothetical protein
MDKDGDGKVSRSDFVHAVGLTVTGPLGSYDRVIRPLTDAVIDVIAGPVGTIEKWAFLAWFTSYGVAEDAARTAYGLLDPARRGHLTRADMHTAVEDFYRSADPGAPGSSLLGPV